MRADAAIAFLRMHAAAAAVGVGLQVNSAWRSMEKQRELYASYVAGAGALASKPGYSNHQGGIAVDIQTGGTGTAVYRWLEQNAARFGFKRTVVSEPWHWEYRPSEVAP
jgi:LAS superfamily LD-carboxypeptidase LdcB